MLLLAIVGVGALVWPLGYWPFGSAGELPAPSGEGGPAAVIRPLAGGLDVTFLVTADLRCGAKRPAGHEPDGTTDPLLALQVDAMNALPDATWPGEGLDGDKRKVGAIHGVLVAGDLTERGSRGQWDTFVRHFGRDGLDGRLGYPVYEAPGARDAEGGDYVARQVAERHGSVHYSWDWDDLHVVSLGAYPTGEALGWLRGDLASAGKARPIVLMMHDPPPGQFAKEHGVDKPANYERLAEIIAGFRVIAIFHGRQRSRERGRWKGIDVFNAGAAKRGTNTFAVARVTDTTLRVGYYDWRGGRLDGTFTRTIGGPADSRPADNEK